jgi:O-antigen/teichoic acid export membrane protein
VNLRAQAARGLKWQAIEIAGRQILGLVVFTTLARLLDPSAFGLVGLVAVYLAFVGMFAEQGLSTALIQRKELEPQHVNAAFWFNLACAALLCAATIAAAPLAARLFAEPRLEPLLRWASLGLVVNASAAVHGALFMRAMDFRRPMLRALIANLAGGAVGIGMAVAGYGVWALIGQQLTAAAAGAAFLWTASPWRPSLGFSFTHLRQLMAVSASVFVTGLLFFFSGRTDQLLIGKFLGAASLGFYTVALRFADLAKTSLYQPLGAVALPTLSRVQHDRSRLHAAIARAMEINALISFPCLLGLSAVATSLLPLLLGSRWQFSGEVLQLLAVYVLLHGMWCITHYALIASGSAGTVAGINLLQTTGAVSACVIGVQYGLRAVVIGLIINDLVMNAPRLYFLWKRTGFSPARYLTPCVVPGTAAGLMYLAIASVGWLSGASDPSWSLLSAQILAGTATYALTILLLVPETLRQLWTLIGSGLRGATVPETLAPPLITTPLSNR